jgi:hypothetical protein
LGFGLWALGKIKILSTEQIIIKKENLLAIAFWLMPKKTKSKSLI